MSYLLRSMLFIPGNNEKFIMKAATCEADAIIFDLEDSVPPSEESKARILLRQYLETDMFEGKQIFLRVNELETESLLRDMELLGIGKIMGIVSPKVCSVADINRFEALLMEQEVRNGFPIGKFKLLPLIETAAAVVNVQKIAGGSKRIIALLLGGEDYLDSVWGEHLEPPQALETARSMVVMAARMNGILPIDTPYLDLKNEVGFVAEETKSHALGFAGILLVTPNQIPWAHCCYSPTREEVEHAEAVLNAVREAQKAGGSIAKLNGKMIGPPMRKRAEKVLMLEELIRNKAGKAQ